jgi:hypothetical protein
VRAAKSFRILVPRITTMLALQHGGIHSKPVIEALFAPVAVVVALVFATHLCTSGVQVCGPTAF